MTTGAIVMMLVAMTFLWGGLGLALFNLTRERPNPPGAPEQVEEPEAASD